MDYLYVVLVSVFIAGQSIIGGFYNKKAGSPFVYNLSISVFVALFYLVYLKFNPHYSDEMMKFAAMFGISFAVYFFSQVMAIREGSVSLTALITSYSLILPTVYAIFAYKEYPSVFFYIGFVLFVLSILFIGLPRKENTLKVTKKWLIFVSIAFVANGLCTIFMAEFQKISGGEQKGEFMFFAMLVASLISLVALIVSREIKQNVKRTVAFGGLCGIINASQNLLVMILAVGSIPVSIVYPTLSAGSLVLSTLISFIFFKEKPDRLGWIGLAAGFLAVILMNI